MRFLTFFAFLINFHLLGQNIVLNSPRNKAVYQRNNQNNGVVPVNGNFNGSNIASVKGRLISKIGGSSTNWENFSVSGNSFTGKLKSNGGWYLLEIEIINQNQEKYNFNNTLVGIGEVLVVAGQSNTLGVGYFSNDERVIGLNNAHSNAEFDYFIDLTSQPNGRTLPNDKFVGPNPSVKAFMSKLGDRLVSHFNVPVLFFSTGASSTTIQEWSRPNTEPYLSLRNCILYKAKELGLRGVLWHQGETNSMYTTTPAESYYGYFRELINNTRWDVYNQELPWSVAKVSWSKYQLDGPSDSDPNSITRRNETRNGQKLTIERIQNVFEGPDSDLIEGYVGSENRKDGVHLTEIGNDQLGNMWFDKLIETGFFSKTTPTESNAIPKESQKIYFNTIYDQYLSAKKVVLAANSTAGLPISYRIISGPAYLNENVLYFNGNPGTIVVEASNNGNNEYFATSEVQIFNVQKQKFDLYFGNIQDVDLSTESIKLNIETNNKADLKIKVNYGPAVIDNNNVLKLLGNEGTVSITAEFPETAETIYNGVTQTFKVNKIKSILEIEKINSKTVLDSLIDIKTKVNSNLPITVTLKSGPAVLKGNQFILQKKSGKVVFTISAQGNEKFESVPETEYSFDVLKLNQTIVFNVINTKLVSDPNFELNAQSSSKLPVTFEKITGPISIENNLVKILGAGIVKIVAKQAGNDIYEVANSVEREFLIDKLTQSFSFEKVTDVFFDSKPIKFKALSNSSLPVTIKVISGPAQYQDSSFVFTGKTGLITAEISQLGNERYKDLQQIFTFKVLKKQTNLTYNTIDNQVFDKKYFTLNPTTNQPSKNNILVKLTKGFGRIIKDTIWIDKPSPFEIEITQDSTNQYEGFKAKLNFEIYKISQSIEVADIPYQFNTVKTVPLTIKYNKKSKLNYKVLSGPAIFTDSLLQLTGQNGKVEIEILQPENEFYFKSNVVTKGFLVSQLVSIEPRKNTAFNVFPNPFISDFEITAKSSILKIELLNTLGNVIFQKKTLMPLKLRLFYQSN